MGFLSDAYVKEQTQMNQQRNCYILKQNLEEKFPSQDLVDKKRKLYHSQIIRLENSW